jgi:hypothetical protein
MTVERISKWQQPPLIVQAGLDESGSLTAATPLFTLAAVVTPQADALRHLIRRAALRSGKRLRRSRKAASELKWSNASQRIRDRVLTSLAKAQVEIFALTVLKGGRRINDTPENYAILACELLSLCWDTHPNVALSLDRHFTSPAQIAVVNTFIHRHWPAQGMLSITHVDSQRSPLVQLADFVAGCVYSWQKENDATFRRIEGRLGAALVKDWRHIKAHWVDARPAGG